MKVLAIGGTGFIGRHVIANLVHAGHEVLLFHRGHTTVPLQPGVMKRIDDHRPAILFEQSAGDFVPCRGYVENVAHSITMAITNPAAEGRIMTMPLKMRCWLV